jgi:hypothetical protein
MKFNAYLVSLHLVSSQSSSVTIGHCEVVTGTSALQKECYYSITLCTLAYHMLTSQHLLTSSNSSGGTT